LWDASGEWGGPEYGKPPGGKKAGQPRVASSDWPARAPCTERGVGVANENRAGIGKAAGRQRGSGRDAGAPHISAGGDER